MEPIEHSVLEKPLDGEPMEGAPVLEPIEYSVLEKPLDGDPMKEMSVFEPLEHSVLLTARNGGPVEGAPVLEPIEHSVLEKPLDGGPLVEMSVLGPLESLVPDVAPVWGDCSLFVMTVSDPLEHSGLDVTVHLDVNSFWVAPWDAGGTLSSNYRPGVAVWRAVLCSVARLSLARVVACWERYLLDHDRSGFSRCRQYLIPPWTIVWIVLVVVCLSCSVVAGSVMGSSRSSEMDQAGPSSASSSPLPGTFLSLALDMRSDKLYDLVPDIPDVMGLRALWPSAAIVKVMSVPDSRCIRVVTPDDHVNIGFHEVLPHDMEDEDLPFVTLSELDCLRRIWPKTLFVFMFRCPDDLERLRKECRERFGSTRSGNCPHCGNYI